ncbi:hypothetical protein BaRGS_00018052, partial [Batillaria attramentaria]
EIDRVWLSSSFFNPDIRKPLVLCVQDIRIQANVGHEGEGGTAGDSGAARNGIRGGRGRAGGGEGGAGETSRLTGVLAKVLLFGQFCGLRVQNLTVMLLKTMMPDSLVHMTASEIALDITIINESYIIKTNLNSVLFKALRSAPGDTDSQNCLAELSVTLHMEAKSDTTQPLQLRTVVGQVFKPQMMLTEGFLQSLPKLQSAASQGQDNVTEPDDEELYQEGTQPTIPAKLRSLKQLSIRDHVDMAIKIYNGFFHYHHEEVQYWSTMLLRVSQGDPTPGTTRSLRRKSNQRPLFLSWLRERKTSIVLDMTQMSSAVSSAACPGFHMQVSQVRVAATIKAAVGLEDMSSIASALDLTLEVEVQSVWCCHLEARVPEEQVTSQLHHWDHLLCLALLIIKVQKLGREVKVEAMEDSVQLEWSTKTFEVLSLLIGAFNRPRSSTYPQLGVSASSSSLSSSPQNVPISNRADESPESLSAFDNTEPLPLNISTSSLHLNLKVDVSNINVFICDSAGVSVLLHVKNVIATYSMSQSALTVDLMKVVYLRYTGPSLALKKVKEVSTPVLHVHEVKANFGEGKKELRVHILRELNFQWTTSAHMCVLQGVQNAAALLEKARPPPRGVMDTAFSLSRFVYISSLFRRPGFQLETLPFSHLQLEREAFKGLSLPVNRGWGISFESFEIVFPYKYNFAACYEEVLNTVKWLKLVAQDQKEIIHG